jgi:hypothetical protein
VRKKRRLRELLLAAGIDHKERGQNTATSKGFSIFSFMAPRHDKVFTEFYWAASEHQRRIIADEVLRWDGSVTHGDKFYSTEKQSADFVQYVFSSLGRTARIMVEHDERDRQLYVVTIRKDGKPLQLCGQSSTGDRYESMHMVPSTDGFKYCFMVPSTFLLFRRNGCVFASGNTAKTLSSLWAWDFLRQEGLSKKLLVVAPLSTLESTWVDQVFWDLPHLRVVVLHGDKAKRLALLKQKVDIYVINHDGVKVILDDLIKAGFDACIIDELSQAARNASTDRWKAYKALIKTIPTVWGMTGTPIPNEPTDAWAQCRLLTPSTVPQFHSHFRDRVMRQVTEFKWVPREGALEVVHEAMQPAIRHRRDYVIDLPPVMYETRHAPLTKEQARAFKEMHDQLYTQVKGNGITAVNEAVKAMKLIQICTGSTRGEDTTVDTPPKHRLIALKEVIEEAASKVIVFVPFRAPLDLIATVLSTGFTVEQIHGGVSKTERDRIFQGFQHGKDPQVLVAQPAAMSHGLTLTAASVNRTAPGVLTPLSAPMSPVSGVSIRLGRIVASLRKLPSDCTAHAPQNSSMAAWTVICHFHHVISSPTCHEPAVIRSNSSSVESRSKMVS